MTLKRTLGWIALAMLTLSVLGCGPKKEPETAPDSATQTTVTNDPPPEETSGDTSTTNDAGAGG